MNKKAAETVQAALEELVEIAQKTGQYDLQKDWRDKIEKDTKEWHENRKTE